MAGRVPTTALSNTGLAFFSSLCASTFGLGCWQTKRYFAKIHMVEVREEEMKREPSADLEKDARCSMGEIIAANGGTIDDKNDQQSYSKISNSVIPIVEERGFSCVLLEGKFRHQDEVLVGPRGPPKGAISASGPNSGRSSGGMASSPQGYFVITPFDREHKMGTVLINRGWVPRQYVQQNAAWNRPNGIVNIFAVPTKTETPRFMSPPHNAREPRQLLWFDRIAIERATKTSGTAPLLLKETVSPKATNALDGANIDEGIPQFPVKPNLQAVGEFNVPPSTHAGYALTWYGLSGAGIFMTRKLMTRGRG